MKQSDFDRAIAERADLIAQTQAELEALTRAREVMFGKKKDKRETSEHKPKEDHPWEKEGKKRGPYKKCSIEGCEGKYAAKGFCHKHYQQNQTKEKAKPEKEEAPPYPPGLKAKISSCCGTTTTEGEKHAKGNMYCDGCEEPCEWIWKPPPSDR